MATNGANIKTSMKKVPPPPPSIGSSSGDSGKPKPPAAPSLAASKRPGGGADSSITKKFRKDLENSGIPNLTQEQKKALANDQGRLRWLFGRGPSMDLTYDTLALGRSMGPVEPELYVDTTFCTAHVLQQLMDVKYDIMKVNKDKFFEVRSRMSTFDKLFGKDTWFVNSDFIKMANIDALTDFQLSQPRNARNESMLGPNELLYFADVCGGPGGFTEYILWKKQWNARGFGFTSKKTDWVLPLKPHYHKECFESIYGFYESKGSGDVHNPEEVNWFIKNVRKTTFRKGVHVAVANGGDTSEGDEDKKELRCKYMILGEVMIAISVVRDGGHFVLRTYDMFTPFTVGLIFLLHQMFDSITIHKPETSLPASSERYVICKWRKVNRYTREVVNYLMDCQKFFKNTQRIFKNADQQVADIQELVPLNKIRNNDRFMSFMLDANELYGMTQLDETRRINEEIKRNGTQALIRQHISSIIRKATTLWGIPKTFTLGAKYTEGSAPEIRAAKLVAPYPPDTFSRIEKEGEQELNFQTMEDELLNASEWHVFLVGRDRGFFLSLGEDEVYRFSGAKWVKAVDRIELAANTLIYADVVDEITIYETRQVTTTGFQIIDALVLGGKDIRNLPHEERLELCLKFARAMDRPNRQDIAAVRAKTAYELNKIDGILRRNTEQRLKGGAQGPKKEATYPIDGAQYTEEAKFDLYFKPSGALLVKTTKQNSIPGDFLFSMQNRLIWRWNENVSLDLVNAEALEDAKEKHGPIHAATLLDFLKPQ